MNQILVALEAIEAAPQGNARLEALKKHDTPELRYLLQQALDPSITFGVKKLPKVESIWTDEASDKLWLPVLRGLLANLSERHLTGNQAQQEIGAFLADCTPLEAKWSERILRQDLRINVGAKDVNNALGEDVILLFRVPLAIDYKKVKPKDLKGTWGVQTKLDGGRAVAILPANHGRVRMLSRTGKEWLNFESVRKVLQEFNDKRDGSALYLDGEVLSYVDGRVDFQSIQKTMMRKDGIEVGYLKYAIFGACEEAEWLARKQTYRQHYELAILAEYAFNGEVDSDRVFALRNQWEVADPTVEQLREYGDTLTKLGHEGAMARRLDLPIAFDKTKFLLKIKTFQDDEAEIEDFIEGTGKYVGMLGAIACRHKNGNRFEIGSGFNDRQRQEIWANREKHRPLPVSYKFFELTDAGIPRFPIFRYFRVKEDL